MESKKSVPYSGVDRPDLVGDSKSNTFISIAQIETMLMRFNPSLSLVLFDAIDKTLKPLEAWRKYEVELQDEIVNRDNGSAPSVTINHPKVYGSMFDVNHNDTVKLGGQNYG